MRLRLVTLTLAAAAALAGCATSAGVASDTSELRVATTVAPITSIVANIAGDRARIAGVVPEGVDSHTFEPRPSDAELLSTADVVYANGLGLEEPVIALAGRLDAEVVELGPRVLAEDEYVYDRSFPRERGRPNPHLWTNPLLAREYARAVAADLSDRDPGNAGYYRSNLTSFSRIVDELGGAMRSAFATVPSRQRKLLTYHDAYAYFAADYGWEVIGAIQVSDFDDPTPREVARLIEQVRAESVPAIFGSEVFPSPVLEQIGREAGVRYVDVLRDDDLPGDPGAPDHSWLGLMRFDYITITEALGGDASALRAVPVRNAAPDTAEYPQ